MAYSADPTLYLYTSLTAGSSHIITATSRLETILKANKIPFRAIDCATDEKARMLWGRRSRGRKLPGLVRFGSVVGDLEQIEEWNEYGELKDQINATSDLSTGGAPTSAAAHPTTINPTGTLHPEPPISSPAPPSNPSSRASSQGRHISISEPPAKDRDKERQKQQEEQPSPTSEPKSKSPSNESPQNLIMRQLGAEAAAKAKDRKASGPGTGIKAAPVPTTSPTGPTTAQTPTPASAKSQDAEPPSVNPDVTAAKTPALLAAEGKSRTSTEKIETNESPTSSPTRSGSESGRGEGDAEEREKSTEEQILAMRRTSTQTKQPSRLSVSTPVEKSGDVLPEQTTEEPETTPAGQTKEEALEAGPGSVAAAADTTPWNPEYTTSASARAASGASHHSSTSSTSIPPPSPSQPVPERRRSHRGSNLEEADIEAIRRAEQALRIQEEDEDEEEDAADDSVAAGGEKAAAAGGELESIDEKEEKILKNAKVGVGKDVDSSEVVDDEKDDDEDDDDDGDENSDGGEGEEEVPKAKVREVDAEKKQDQEKAEVDLPSGKEKDVEAETEAEVSQGSDSKPMPQETTASDPEAAGKSVGD